MCEYEYIKKHTGKIRSAALPIFLSALLLIMSPMSFRTPVFASGSAAVAAAVTATIPVSVVINGENEIAFSGIPAENYTFRLTALNDAPMPENDTLTICGAGSGKFFIAYEKSGVYQYTVEQDTAAVNSTAPDSETSSGQGEKNSYSESYDTTVYYVTVTVQNTEEGETEATVTAHRGSAIGDKCNILFENIIELETEALTETAAETQPEISTESAAEDPTEVSTEAITEDPAGVATEAITEDPAGVSTEAITEDPAGVSTEAITEDLTEVVTEIYTETTEWYLPNSYYDSSGENQETESSEKSPVKSPEESPEQSTASDSDSPQTGDNTAVVFWFVLMLSGFWMTLVAYSRWRSRTA
ncbi:MAG: hypothetical protein LIP12_12075 [Clostridiales bacterium]|nr:hypothetical protein [Clostridiales bacterium]